MHFPPLSHLHIYIAYASYPSPVSPFYSTRHICHRLYNYTIIFTLKICYICVICYETGKKKQFLFLTFLKNFVSASDICFKNPKKEKEKHWNIFGFRLYKLVCVVLYLFYGQTCWQKSMKTNISCIIRRKLLLGVPLATITISSSLSLFICSRQRRRRKHAARLEWHLLCQFFVTAINLVSPSPSSLWSPSLLLLLLFVDCPVVCWQAIAFVSWVSAQTHSGDLPEPMTEWWGGRQGEGSTLAKCWKLIYALAKTHWFHSTSYFCLHPPAAQLISS